MWVARSVAVASLPGLARSLARSLEDALCNESDGVYLNEQEHVPPQRMGVSGRKGEGGEGGDASEAVRAPSCRSMIYALA